MKLHQYQYVMTLLNRFNMTECYPVSTPADPNVILTKADDESKLADKQLYQQIVGSLQYAAGSSRPDIAFAVNAVARHCNEPREIHMTAARRILRYLKGTADLGLVYHRTGDDLVGFSDADWAGDHRDRKSTSGNVFLVAGAAVDWASRKQTSVALSTVEAEYIALSSAIQEATWLRCLLDEIKGESDCPTTIFEDNQGAIAVATNPVFHRRTKHVEIRYHHVREAVEAKEIELKYCQSREMVADILTKPLPRDQFENLRYRMGIQ